MNALIAQYLQRLRVEIAPRLPFTDIYRQVPGKFLEVLIAFPQINDMKHILLPIFLFLRRNRSFRFVDKNIFLQNSQGFVQKIHVALAGIDILSRRRLFVLHMDHAEGTQALHQPLRVLGLDDNADFFHRHYHTAAPSMTRSILRLAILERPTAFVIWSPI